MSYPLHQLKDIHPGPPPAPDWLSTWLVPVLLLLGLAAFCLLLYRLWPLIRAYRQLRRLGTHQPLSGDNGVPALNLWLKATALQLWPRTDIASLHGSRWLRFLDQSADCNFMAFASCWEEWLYGARPISQAERQTLLLTCHRWLRAQFRRCLWSR